MWIVFALCASVFWAIVHVLDEHCIDQILLHPWMGIVTSSAATGVVLGFLFPFLLVYFPPTLPSAHLLLLGICAGLLIQMAQFFYFTALSYSEAGVVSAYWNIVPALLPIASYLAFKEVLSIEQYCGIIILILTSTWMSFFDHKSIMRFSGFFLMLIGSIFMVWAFLVEEYLYKHVPFIAGFSIILSSMSIIGLLPLIFRRVRLVFQQSILTLSQSKNIFIGIEFANVFALLLSQKAISIGTASLASAVQTTIPAFVFVLSATLFKITKKFGTENAYTSLHWKFLVVSLMCIGVLLVSNVSIK